MEIDAVPIPASEQNTGLAHVLGQDAPCPGPSAAVRWGQLYGSAPALALAQLASEIGQPLWVLTSGTAQAEHLHGELASFLDPDLPLFSFPDWETLPYDLFSPYQDIISKRLEALKSLITMQRGIMVCAAPTALQRLAPRNYIEAATQTFRIGQRIDFEALCRQLEAAGYIRTPQVHEHGEFSVRGALLDLYPMGSTVPYRIDLFDDEIESIRSFDPETQRTIELTDSMRVLPARELPLDGAAVRAFRQRYRRRFEGDPGQVQIYREVSEGIAPGGIEYYLPLFFDTTATLFDYLPDNTLIVDLDDAAGAVEKAWSEIEQRYDQRRHDRLRPLLAPHEVCIEPAEFRALAASAPRLALGSFKLTGVERSAQKHNFGTRRPPDLFIQHHDEKPAAALLAFLKRYKGRVLFVAESAGRRETLLEILGEQGIRAPVVAGWAAFLASEAPLAITVAPLQNGLLLTTPPIAVIAENQLFGNRVRQRRRRRTTRDPDAIIRNLNDLNPGAPVVHEDHGVGRYQGLQTLSIGGIEAEFMMIGYAGDDKLYVPVHALQRVTRYTGTSPESAPLHRLGGEQWEKARRRAARKVRDVAVELLDIYARRAARGGHEHALDATEYRAFSAAFPFEETDDQRDAIDMVVTDMTADKSMDRVVCGDVGFGKTEVALRAAFVAAQGGKQTAVLVPTTLLAQQHGATFQDRFADWPIRVEVLSRFRTRQEIQSVLEGVEKGLVDIVIGTHRLLQKDVRFKQLGLVIVDEEHRFGVRHKERLKSMRSEVDVLTLTATPIPRTLNMAMGGIRDLSLITTPPAERLAVKTFVSEWSDTLIRDAVMREIKRGGQVYVIHNAVRTIDKMRDRLAKLIPEADIRIGHGQMRERDLEQVMLDFAHRRFSLLLCTTIVESGIDVPSANTMIIDRADKFGLAQLHQLRGRVGRSHHRAYAYLIAPPRNSLTDDAAKRLEAIESLEDLGAGFTLATHDLEIRGAGELLGQEQSGQIQEVGFTLYMELLERAVEALKSGREPDLEAPLDHGPDVDLHVPALLPDSYMPDVHLRLILYKRIAGAEDEDALRELKIEMIDRFGLLPDTARTLFDIAAIKIAAAPLGIRRIAASSESGRVEFAATTGVNPLTLVQLVESGGGRYRLDGPSMLRFSADMASQEDRFTCVRQLLKVLSRDAAPSS